MSEFFARRTSSSVPCGDQLAAARTGARSKIENVIRRANCFLVVLHHDDRVPEIAQPSKRRQQPLVVALMQADARLIEHVENADQTRADLRRQPDALRFAAGKCAAFAVQA